MARQNVVRWGNSLAVRIPAAAAELLGLVERSQVTLAVKSGVLTITPSERVPEFSDEDFRRALRQLKKAEARDRVAALDLRKRVGREVW